MMVLVTHLGHIFHSDRDKSTWCFFSSTAGGVSYAISVRFFHCRQADMEIDLVGSVDAPSRKVSGVPRWLILTAH